MRVFFLAAIIVCASGLPLKAQPSKMQPQGSGLIENVALTPASGPISDLIAEATKIESIDSANARPTEIEPKGSRVATLARADIKLANVKPQRSPIEQLKDTNTGTTPLEGDRPGIAGLTGAMRDVQMMAGASPWLMHALNDVGTNPGDVTGAAI